MRQVKITNRSRAIYDALPKRKGVISTPSYLRLESAALGTQSTISFNTLVGQGTVNETERRLNLTDTFTVTEMAVFILKVTTAGTNYGDVLHTFPNDLVFSGSNEAANLMNLYNGYFSAKVNGTTYIDSLDIMRFYRVGVAQQAMLTAASGTGNAYQASQWDAGSYGFFPLTPTFKLSGAWKNELSISCPRSVSMAGTSSTNYAVCYLRGFLNQNEAQFNS